MLKEYGRRYQLYWTDLGEFPQIKLSNMEIHRDTEWARRHGLRRMK
jgi:hypothetical protein